LVAWKSYGLAAGDTNPQGIADPPGPSDDATISESSSVVNEQYINIDINPSFNSFNATDVNSDGITSPIDALLIINRLNAMRQGLDTVTDAWLYDDVSNDRTLSPLDALLVINKLISSRSNSEPLAAPLPETVPVSNEVAASFAPAAPELGMGEGESVAAKDAYFASYAPSIITDSESESSPFGSTDRSTRSLRRISR
jgi:hypothetical protein